MSKNISKRQDTDFVWTKDLSNEPTTLIVYYQGEQGFASLVAGSSLVGNKEPVCKIFSKLHQVDPMNSIPMPTYPEWKMHEVRNEDGRRYFILRLSHAYIPSPEQTKSWLYNYPVIRDIIMELNDYGLDELIYITSHIMQDFLYSEQPQIPENELLVYDYLEPEDTELQLTNGEVIDDLELILPAPSWIVCNIFNNFCLKSIRGNWLVMCANNKNTYLNTNEADRLLEYFYDVHGLAHDKKYYNEMMGAIKHAEHMGDFWR